MPKRPPIEPPKVSMTVTRLLALEDALGELRRDLNDGVGRLLAGLERLEKAIDRVAEIRPRLDALELRVDRLEQRPS